MPEVMGRFAGVRGHPPVSEIELASTFGESGTPGSG